MFVPVVLAGMTPLEVVLSELVVSMPVVSTVQLKLRDINAQIAPGGKGHWVVQDSGLLLDLMVVESDSCRSVHLG